MSIEKVHNNQSFQGLNIQKVAHNHRKFVRADLGALKKLGDQYDIVMKSNIGECASNIDITVTKLKKDFNFIQRLNLPKGKSCFYTDSRNTYDTKDTTVLGQTLKAIDDLRKNTLLRVIKQ